MNKVDKNSNKDHSNKEEDHKKIDKVDENINKDHKIKKEPIQK